MTVLLAMYAAYVGQRAIAFMETGDPVAVGIGAGLLVMPLLAIWWLAMEWRLGIAVQRMGDRLGLEGRLPLAGGSRSSSRGEPSPQAHAAFERARAGAEARPDDWSAWFEVGFAYEAAGDKRMARRALSHAASLFREESRRS
ncbi:hypothetical protein RN607_08650 [Demequina capsici]|nr:hypothetical protein [Demequina sp. PMTSA13]WNM26269.1 hypothetical protein RN607_08650 [Demequina sp. PMTSA13]